MSEIRAKYDEEFKKNAVKLSYARPKSVKQVAEDLGINAELKIERDMLKKATVYFANLHK